MKLKRIVIPVLILAAALYVFYSKKNRDIPANLIGEWTTSSPGYQDRFIELTKETLVYGIGGDKEEVYTIISLGKTLEGKNTIYTINYKNSEVKFTRSFYYHPEDVGIIQFKHQEHIKWRKTKNTVVEENSEPDQNMKAGQNATNN
jgi:hypothetical protein